MVTETIARIKNKPTRGDWCVHGQKMNLWVDASSLVIGVLLEKDGTAIKDTCWLQLLSDVTHINLAELDIVLKGIKLALQ